MGLMMTNVDVYMRDSKVTPPTPPLAAGAAAVITGWTAGEKAPE